MFFTKKSNNAIIRRVEFNMDFIKNKLLFVVDLIVLVIAYIIASFLKFGINQFSLGFNLFTLTFGLVAAIHLISFAILKLYKRIWENAGFLDYLNVILAFIISFSLSFLIVFLMHEIHYTLLIIFELVFFMGVIGLRFAFRLGNRLLFGGLSNKKHGSKRVLIFGAGQAASLVIRDIEEKHLDYQIVGLIDDDDTKQGSSIRGYHVIGTRKDLIALIETRGIHEVILAIPSISAGAKKEIIDLVSQAKVKIKTISGLYEMIDGRAGSGLRNVEIQDLLGRPEINLDAKQIEKYIHNKVVLVTGGGGSIGSELCRQIASFNPSKLVIVDIYENNAYEIQNELIRHYPYLKLETLIASVRDKEKIKAIMLEHKPEIVFHAAAHKHVPLMERSPAEAVKNNVFGTFNVGQAAIEAGVERFILISTDKAVNPTNVMGATKRLDEMIIQMLDRKSKTTFVAVRFGNVLGSNGSVIPLFKKQIAEGGPVTVTHKDITRFFMTIPEAVSLVLQAGYYASAGEIFVLDMGKPVRIYELAENLIRLSGYIPNVDMPIVITGLRPGEKLYEELLMSEEGLKETPNQLIHIGKPVEFNEAELVNQLNELQLLVNNVATTNQQIKEAIASIVTTYTINS